MPLPANEPATRAYAHTLPPPATIDDWETYEEHRDHVAALAGTFAAAFGASEWGRLAGLWHDVGKLQPAFQRYLRGEIEDGPPHAWAGAMLALTRDQRNQLPIALAIAAHHGSLANVKPDAANGIPVGSTLLDSVQRHMPKLALLRPLLADESVDATLPRWPEHVLRAPPDGAAVEFFTRFLFSALVDADRLATAHFYRRFDPALSADDFRYDDIDTLLARLERAIDAMPPKGSPAVIALRRTVLKACRTAATRPPGRFSLTVPTGGGKTLGAMNFALAHAALQKLRRVIIVIPYTSIIEQSAKVYADVLGKANVLEHHTNLDEQRRRLDNEREEDLRKLAAENWDAPVVVTTTVQFFHSLLADHGSRCRKLHNIARSVVILDEVQTLPPQFLRTVLDVLAQLTDGYGCSVVFSTATPPALKAKDGSNRPGLTNVSEIVDDPSALAASARRVAIDWRVDAATPYVDLARELRTHRQVLAIVHRRDDARQLVERVGGDALHLSALMCPAHRTAVVADVKRRLAAGDACRLISTQLIEAGVDVDFPIVYRALGGLDSIAQSAGRCDREGRLTDANGGVPAGRMIVFRAETDPPPGVPVKALDSMSVMLKLGGVDPFDPRDSERFFDELYRKIDDDQHGIEPLRRALAFGVVAERFKIIDEETYPIVVPWGEGAERLLAYRRSPRRETRRALQPFTVQVRKWTLEKLRGAGVCWPVDELGFFDAINERRETAYDKTFGLDERADGVLPAEASIV